MLDRRDVLFASISAMAPALAVPAFGQTTSLPQLKGEFLQRPGCKIYYEVAGSGPAIIFSHVWGAITSHGGNTCLISLTDILASPFLTVVFRRPSRSALPTQ